jgi:predicted hydrocarbon binding protein
MNIFKRDATLHEFSWENLGDVKEGRGDLGEDMPVIVYRLMQYTMLDILTKDFGADKANEYFRRAGFLAGQEFAKNLLDLTVDLDKFLADLQNALKEQKIGILRMEAFDPGTGNMVLTVGQDLDCSGLPITNETVCNYDEGFIAGILNAYTGKEYEVKEVDCWANGDRVCRFNGTVSNTAPN